ncbi:peroxiredoxin family protein [Bernardetia sp. OM2101]|uniref:peroxiredoxin family protein n=1 Tax=Bernardetia sp. OM2101 TaxID=3344876 RepID=UPI0035CECD17
MTKITKGSSAIHFSKKDTFDKNIDLKNYEGQKIFISFFRKAACPFCNMRVQELIKRNEDFKKENIQIIAFFASSKEDILKYVGKQNPPFPIIADKDFKVYQKYGIDVSYNGMFKAMLNPKKALKAMFGGFFSLKTMAEDPVLPANFLIDENQNIHKVYYGSDYDDHLPISEILAWK